MHAKPNLSFCLAKGGLTMAVDIKDVVIQEIRNALAVHGREIVMQSSSKKTQAQADMIEKAFHGTESHESIVNLFLGGKQPD